MDKDFASRLPYRLDRSGTKLQLLVDWLLSPMKRRCYSHESLLLGGLPFRF